MDISRYDNVLLNSINIAVKNANMDAQDEGEEVFNKIDNIINKALPVLKSIDSKDLFNIFRQKTKNGNLTNHIVNPLNTEFYKDYKESTRELDNSNTYTNLIKFTNWASNNTVNTNLLNIFPLDNNITEEVIKNRNTLKIKLGEGVYNYWFKKQEKAIEYYNERKESYKQHLVDKYELNSIEDIDTNLNVKGIYNYWLIRNSPYELENLIFRDSKISNVYPDGYNNYKYYSPISINEEYLDKDFNIIKNNPILIELYNIIEDTFNKLNKYVPDHQQKTLAYGGLPLIEKSIYELYSEEGLNLGFKPIYDTLIKSVQTNFSDKSISTIDPVTNKPIDRMNISIIKNYTDEINKQLVIAESKFLVDNKREATSEEINRMKEDIKHNIYSSHSFDLIKVLKLYSTMVLAHKHKSKIEKYKN